VKSSHNLSTPRRFSSTRRSFFFSTEFTKHAARLCLLCALLLSAKARAQTPPVVVIAGDAAQQQAQASPTPTQQQGATDGASRGTVARDARRAALGSIKGRVVGESGEALAGVSVYAIPRAFNPAFRSPRTAAADDEGNFTINGLEPGVYSIGANMPGYVADADPLTGRPFGPYRTGDTATVRLVKGGVITGAVTDPQGEPLVAMSVRAYRVRDLDGRAAPTGFNFASEDKTDDRGVYRIYGLPPGAYVVVAGGFSQWSFGFGSAYDADSPTFYPSATRDTASEVSVRAGQETSGVDVRYRDEQGHRVTGTIEAGALVPEANSSIGVTLYYASTSINAGNAWMQTGASEHPFSLEGIADGDYDLQASGGGRDGLTVSSAPQRIMVKGADVTGLRIRLTPLASISGSVVIEQASDAARATPACKSARASLLPQETLVTALADRPHIKNQLPTRTPLARDASPDDAGAFTLRSLEAGRYRLAFRPLDENLYVSTVQLPAAAAANATTSNANAVADAKTRVGVAATPAPRAATTNNAQRTTANAVNARDVLDIKPGQQLTGVAVRLSEGAAGLSGRVVAAEGAAPPPFAQLRVYLLPAERERADDALRYFETATNSDGSFNFKNLPPGRYLLLARTVDLSDATPRPAAWDSDSRARLRRDAESANTAVELQPCQRTTDFALHFPQTPPK
jgi:protocatechuate 3,4-dioxygenase beta subunit